MIVGKSGFSRAKIDDFFGFSFEPESRTANALSRLDWVSRQRRESNSPESNLGVRVPQMSVLPRASQRGPTEKNWPTCMVLRLSDKWLFFSLDWPKRGKRVAFSGRVCGV